jgi:hypothetical protein
MDKIKTVLFHRYAGKAWCYNGDGYEGVHWSDSMKKPTEKELLEQFDDVMAEIEAEKLARQNASESARAKLAALGLTEAEVKAIIGG